MNDKKPLISIILPIYNIEKYLPKCMDSIFSQTYTNLEIIMVDDGATDGCGKLCDQYAQKDPRICVYHKVNGGLSDARNYGIEHASGEYITCIDPDDYVDPDYIDYLHSLIKTYNTRMSICLHRVLYDNGSVKDLGGEGTDILSAAICLEKMMYHDVIDTTACAKLYHRDLFRETRYPKGRIFEDIGTTYKLMMQCDFIAVGYESKYNYIFHNNSIVNSEFKPNKLDLLEMTDKMAEDVLQVYPELKKAVLRRQVYARFSTLNQMLNATGYEKERQKIISFIKQNGKIIRKDPKLPKRDRMAMFLLNISFRLYRICWLSYQRYLMKT